MSLWQHWIVGQIDASIAAALLLAIALLARHRISPRVRSVILLIALVRLALPPWIRSPWSEAAVEVPSIGATRIMVVNWLQSDAASYAFAATTVVAVVLLTRLVWQIRHSHRHWMSTTTPAPEAIQTRARAFMTGESAIEVRVSSGGDGPLAAGIRRRLIVLPAAAIRLEPAALDAALAHEAAHHVRGDLIWIAGVRALAAIAWFNPLAHLVARAVVASREDGSDDWAVSRTSNDPFTYCRSLLHSARCVAVDRDAVTAHAHPMGQRLRRLLDGRAARDRRLGVAGLIGIIAAMTLCIPGAHMPEAASRQDDQAVIVHRIINKTRQEIRQVR